MAIVLVIKSVMEICQLTNPWQNLGGRKKKDDNKSPQFLVLTVNTFKNPISNFLDFIVKLKNSKIKRTFLRWLYKILKPGSKKDWAKPVQSDHWHFFYMGYPQWMRLKRRPKILNIWRFKVWFLVSAFNWVFCWFSKLKKTSQFWLKINHESKKKRTKQTPYNRL